MDGWFRNVSLMIINDGFLCICVNNNCMNVGREIGMIDEMVCMCLGQKLKRKIKRYELLCKT